MRTFDVDERRGFVEAVWVVGMAFGSCLFGQGSACGGQAVDSLPDETHTQRPNIVLIVVDDLGYGDLGCYGSSLHQTPNIDRLAREGMRLTDFHTNGAVCSPTRVAILSGQYQQRSGIESAIGFTLEEGMPLEKLTIADALRGAGYACGVFGKWHVGHVSRFGPNDQGFDVSYCSNNSPDYHTHVSRVGDLDWFKNHQLYKESGYLTDIITGHTIDFMSRNRDQPFFAFVSHVAVHFPFQGPDDAPHRTLGKIWHDEKYGPLPEDEYRRAYRDMLEAVDASVGETVAKIEQLGLTEKTLVFVTSDNGAYSWVGSNGPYSGEKGSLLEGGHRVPGIAWWPSRIPPGTVSNALLMTMDLLPTFAVIASVDLPSTLHLDGIDASGTLLRNESLDDRTVFWRSETDRAARRGSWKWMIHGDGPGSLFNLDKDPGERRDLAAEQTAIASDLSASLVAWEADVDGGRIDPGQSVTSSAAATESVKLADTVEAGAATQLPAGRLIVKHEKTKPTEREIAELMLDLPQTGRDPDRINFRELPRLRSEHAIISDVLAADGGRVNQHAYLAHHDGRYWAMWSDGPGASHGPNRVPDHDLAAQRVSFATSVDGMVWSETHDLSGAPAPGFGFIARGYWQRDGELLALASHFRAPGYAGEGLSLEAFRLDATKHQWVPAGTVRDDTLNNFPPKKLPDGRWMMSRRDHRRQLSTLVGGVNSMSDWEVRPMSSYGEGQMPEEPYWYLLPDGKRLVGMFRDNSRSGRLMRAISEDAGQSWSELVQTNFPDARSKFFALRTSRGYYVMVSNANPARRDPLVLSVSEDGLVYTRMAYLVGGRHVDYPHMIEHDDHLMISFSGVKQTVEVLKVPLSAVDQLLAGEDSDR